MKYKLFGNNKTRPDGKTEYLTATERKYFPLAVEFCEQNKISECRVNRIVFRFDFESLTFWTSGPMAEGHFFRHYMKEA